MRRRVILVLILLLLLGLILLWLLMSSWPQDADAAEEFPYLPWITEILPEPTVGEAPTIELQNPLNREVDAAGLKLVINDTYEYVLPEDLPPLPAGGFVLIKLDGKGTAAGDHRYQDGVAILHASPELNHAFEREEGESAGQIAIYRMDNPEAQKLVGFVAWGRPAAAAGRSLERARIWPIGRFVSMTESFGLYPPETNAPEAYSIGIHPLSRRARPQDWVVYSEDEITLGRPNAAPAPKQFTAPDGTVFRSGDLAVGWTGNGHAKEYEFELSRNRDFSDIVDRTVLKQQLYRPSEPLPTGEYFYRVRAIYADGSQSGWSSVQRVLTKQMSGSLGGPEFGAVEKRVVQAADFRRQRKDTPLLCIDGCASEHGLPADQHWDAIHPDDVPISGHDHGDMNCVRASMSMIASHFGRQLSQDRIAHYDREGRPGRGDGTPRFDLAHSVGYAEADVEPVLEWVLDEAVDRSAATDPSFADIQGWLDTGRPVMTATWSHMRVLSAYRIDDAGDEWVQIMDPWTGPPDGIWQTYASWAAGNQYAVWIGPVNAAHAREDEDSVWDDSDGDGVMDFDEQIRFATKRFNTDADNDDVDDKNDIREYVFTAADTYGLRTADLDADTMRKENDPDNDHDTFGDGCEDANGNGKKDPGESGDNFDAATAGLTCSERPVHCIIVFDRSGSMRLPSADPKYDRAVDAASLFLETWLLNAPVAGTEIGVVFYDHTAFFDVAGASDSTLEALSAAKRDKIFAAFGNNTPGYGSTSIGGGIIEAMDAPGFDIENLPEADQRRVVIVLTDGKENASPRMDSFQVLQGLVQGQVAGYVLGIGDEPQIDADKLDALADILGNSPASYATDLAEGELEKFFLQVLANTRGLDFSVDPSGTLASGGPESISVPVSQGARRATFVLVWNDPDASLDFTLSDPNGKPVKPSAGRLGRRYRVTTTDNPVPGDWTLSLTAATGDVAGATEPVAYSLMVLESNDQISTRFDVRGSFYTDEPMLVVADLSMKRERFRKAKVRVDVKRPTQSIDEIMSSRNIDNTAQAPRVERNVIPSRRDEIAALMAKQGIERATLSETIWLNDVGQDGDAIPGDGRYSGHFGKTAVPGIYSFRFIADAIAGEERDPLHREKLISVQVRPRIQPLLEATHFRAPLSRQ